MAQVSLDLIFRGVDKGVGALQQKLGAGIHLNTQQLQRMGMVAMGAGAAILGALAAMTMSAAKYGDEIAKAAAMTNTSVEALSGLRYAADRAGVSFEDLTMSLARQARAAREAMQGVATYKDAYDRLGITVTDAQGKLKSSKDLFIETAGALSKLQGSQEQTALAMDIFGRSGAKLLPLFNQGADGIENLMERAKELGLVLDEDTAKAAERFNDALADVKDSLKGVAIQVGQHIFPAIASLAEQLADAIGLFNRFADAHPYLAKMAILATMALGGLLLAGGGLLVLIIQLMPLITALGGAGGLAGLGTAAAGATTAIAGTSTAIAGLGTAAAGLAAAAAPFLLIAAAAGVALWSINRTWKEAIKAEAAFKSMEKSADALAETMGKPAPKGSWWETFKGTMGFATKGSQFIEESASQAATPEQIAAGRKRAAGRGAGGTTNIYIEGNLIHERQLKDVMDGRIVKAGSY